MMFDFEYGCLYDLMIAMIKLLPWFIAAFVWDEWYDRVSHARVFHVRMGMALFCLRVDMYVFWDECCHDCMCKCTLVCVCEYRYKC